jgi:UDP-N-acetylglucosamine--N-acetylmuramyl-(pentapeptide) pyrophosphoryl-undecaprenol N-acetylglucosamine transferase
MPSVLLVCSSGGHLKQLVALTERIGIAPDDQFWITAQDGQSRTLLADRRVVWSPYAGPRDAVNILRTRLLAKRVLARHRFDLAISTGSSPAVAFLPLAARAGAEAHYIESAARANGPSVSGKLIARNPQISTYTQYPTWSDDRWHYRGSIFDEYVPGPSSDTSEIRRAVVSVGTQDGYHFDRLYQNLVPLLSDCEEVLWQTGPQDVSGYGIKGRHSVPHHELRQAVAEADVVVAHSGTGAALTALEQGKCPVLVPRLARRGEHVDDHQIQIGGELQRRGLAIMCDADMLSRVELEVAAGRSVRRVLPPPFELDGAGAGVRRRDLSRLR